MNKVVDFLEKHVQWLALGLGAVWLLLMVWAYVLSSPVRVEMANQTYTPSNFDERLRREADELASAIRAGGTGGLDVNVSSRERVESAFNLPAREPLPLALVASRPGEVSEPSQHLRAGAGDQQVVGLPQVPAPLVTAVRSGIAFVELPESIEDAAPITPVRIGAAIPVREPQRQDMPWVFVRYAIPVEELTQAFRQANIRQGTQTAFLYAQLERQEQASDGSWGEASLVPPLDISEVWPLPEFPGGQATTPEQRRLAGAYVDWAKNPQNTPLVLQPSFFPVVAGDDPMFEPVEETLLTPETFDPSTHVGGRGTLTEAQWRAVLDYRRQAAAERARQPRTGGGTATPRGRGGDDAYYERVILPPKSPFLQVRRPAPDPYSEGTGYDEGGYDPTTGEYYGDPGMGGTGATPQGTQVVGGIPVGPFDPATVAEIQGWAFDTTAVPGRTYRYRVRYHLTNPLYDTRNVAANAELEETVWIASRPGETWSESVTMPSGADLFLAGNFSPNAESARFEVFGRQEGRVVTQTFNVPIGGSIGEDQTVAGGGNFRTAWTLVDLRSDSARNTSYALLMDAEGNLTRRSFDADRNDPRRAELQELVTQQASLDPTGPAGALGIRGR